MYTWSFAITRPRCSGCGSPSGSHSSRTNETPTTCEPAGDGHAKLQARVAADLHVLLPRIVSGEPGLAVAGVAGRRGPPGRAAADA